MAIDGAAAAAAAAAGTRTCNSHHYRIARMTGYLYNLRDCCQYLESSKMLGQHRRSPQNRATADELLMLPPIQSRSCWAGAARVWGLQSLGVPGQA